jgi:serine/threonine-protein kinase
VSSMMASVSSDTVSEAILSVFEYQIAHTYDGLIASALDRVSIAWHARRSFPHGEFLSALGEPSTATSPFAFGSVLGGKFEIRGVIGEGGMGLVYDAYQIAVDRRVAIKVLHNFLMGDASACERFRQEARMVAQIQHPNIVTMHDAGVENDVGYLVFEYLSGRSLSAETGKAMELGRALNIARQLCRALEAAHRAGIVHRDLKPSNVFLVQLEHSELVKLLDFGIAKSLTRERSGGTRLTSADERMGTLRYMSPEQIRDDAVDHRSDLYALGCLLFFMLTGFPPFRDPVGPKLAAQHLVQPAPRFVDVRPELSIDIGLEAIVRRLLRKRPEERFESAASVEVALDEWAARMKKEGRTNAQTEFSRPSSPALPVEAVAGGTKSELVLPPPTASPPARAERTAPTAGTLLHRRRSLTRARLGSFAAGSFLALLVGLALRHGRTGESIEIQPIVGVRAQPVLQISAEPTPALAGDLEAATQTPLLETTYRERVARSAPPIRLRNIAVEAGSLDRAQATSILEARESEIVACYRRTQLEAHSRRTLRLHFASSNARQTIHVEPKDETSEAFLACLRSLAAPIALEKSTSAAIAIVSVEIGPATKKVAP